MKKTKPKQLKLEMVKELPVKKLALLEPDEIIPKNPEKKPKKKSKSRKEMFDDVLIFTKSTLKKILKGMPPNPHVEFFQHTGLSSIVIFDDEGKELKTYKGSRKTKWLKEVEKKWPDAKVLIHIKEGYLKMIPVRALVKLSKIDKMVITHEITMIEDGNPELYVLERECYEITDISGLLKVLLTESIWIDAIIKMTGDCMWYNVFETIHTVMVEMKDGEKLYYDDTKDDNTFVDFLNKFGLDLYLK